MDATSSSNPDARIVPIHDAIPLPSPAQKLLVDMEEMMNKATKRLESQVLVKPTRIHMLPQHLRDIGGADGRYVVPSVVAIGPYHHGLPHLQEMEEDKLAAAHSFCRDSGRSVEEVYEKIFSVAGDARRCYATDDAKSLAARLGDTEFAAMMFLDGCFLLQFMANSGEPPMVGRIMVSGHRIAKDIFLLENQVPWLVLEVLMDFKPVEEAVRGWISATTTRYFFERNGKRASLCRSWCMWFQTSLQQLLTKCHRVPEEKTTAESSSIRNGNGESSKPPHLLGLLRSILISGMPPHKRKGGYTSGRSYLSLSSSAVYLAQIGVKLTTSRANWFADVKFKKKLVFGELSVSPLFFNDMAACYLFNLAALEAAEAIKASNVDSDGYVVTSYLSVLEMLMDREEDVHHLRGKGVLHSSFSNAQTLDFFKDLRRHLRSGNNYYAIMQEIYGYMDTSPLRIVVHKFMYNNFKLIAAILSIASVLIGIFKAIYSLKQS